MGSTLTEMFKGNSNHGYILKTNSPNRTDILNSGRHGKDNFHEKEYQYPYMDHFMEFSVLFQKFETAT